ncbi:putative lysophospholipase BODYGUARD 3 [Citrus sinensis]|nr:putative lysophospholipase BODYGUARD 3 [Citrus sinensis]
MLQGKIGGQQSHPIPRWSDCDCKFCTCWSSSSRDTLFVKTQGPSDEAHEDVLFIHGFISSSAFWTETLFPNFSSASKSTYRLFAIDLLGFGRSPKPTDSLYTVREHLDMIEKSVIEPNKVKSFHIVAHSLGCILALALAVKHPGSVKSLTLLAPPYYPVPKGAQASQYVMRKVAPRRVWPLIAFGASMACWYEHISRTICLLICKNHRVWEFLAKLVTRNRIRTFLLEGFFCHTHNAAWHTLHNIICGTANKLDGYLDAVRNHVKCDVNVFHGEDDELIPVECSYNVQRKIPRARVKVIEKKDHITIVVGRQKTFARELEEIWRSSSGHEPSENHH